MDYANTKTPSMHRRLGSATLSHLAFPGESNQNFLWEKSQRDDTVVKKKKKKSDYYLKKANRGKFASFVSFCPIKKRSFNLVYVLKI